MEAVTWDLLIFAFVGPQHEDGCHEGVFMIKGPILGCPGTGLMRRALILRVYSRSIRP